MSYYKRSEKDEKRYQFAKAMGCLKRYVPIYEQVYKVNGMIFKMRYYCKKRGICLENYKPFKELLEEASIRFRAHGYRYNGNLFVKIKEEDSVFSFDRYLKNNQA